MSDKKKVLPKENRIAEVLATTGKLLIIASFILSIILGNDDGNFILGSFLVTLITGVIFGILVIGLSEIVELLHKINTKLNK